MLPMFKRICVILILSSLIISCSSDSSTEPETDPNITVNDVLVDSLATPETVALFNNIMELSQTKLLFGHQETTAYGVGWWAEFGKSDVKEVCSDYPAVYGWDIGDIQYSTNVDGVYFSTIVNLIKQAYSRGGINTISMHLDNPATDNDAWDNTPAVASILPGGVNHDKYINILDMVADFFLELKTSEGTYIPIIFRPYHEHTHAWPWWGSNSCSVDEYNSLWRMTVEYLRDEREVHHLLYAISPQDFYTRSEYEWRYPGDDYVDVLGLDSYNNNLEQLENSLDILGQLAKEKGKICALTEVGLMGLSDPDWFTQYLLTSVKSSNNASRVAWALVWRNADVVHHFAPYPGHDSVPDFLNFYEDDMTVFESDLPDMYK